MLKSDWKRREESNVSLKRKGREREKGGEEERKKRKEERGREREK